MKDLCSTCKYQYFSFKEEPCFECTTTQIDHWTPQEKSTLNVKWIIMQITGWIITGWEPILAMNLLSWIIAFTLWFRRKREEDKSRLCPRGCGPYLYSYGRVTYCILCETKTVNGYYANEFDGVKTWN